MAIHHPIPADALEDRLGYFGTAGSGKTYNAGSGVERLLASHKRCIIPDPLGVWWGLRLNADGKSKGFDVVIFGGPHGDMALSEHHGALIGETVAGMKESCILDLSELGTKAAERRFMLAFLTALYKHTNGEPVHVIFDEADMWAPQKLLDKEGSAAQLLGMMETIVRRGRVRGFIPWLISQRPAVLSKDVLSQVDGLVAFKLTSSQDRDALGDWVKGQADVGQWNELWKQLPTLERGQGVIWLPARSTLKTAHFPEKATFDSSRTPKRGEKLKHKALKPLDLDKLRQLLATVETEAKANDPKALRAEIAKLRKEAADAAKAKPAPVDKSELTAKQERAIQRVGTLAKIEGYADAMKATASMMAGVREKATPLRVQLDALLADIATVEKWATREQKKPTVMTPVTRDDVAKAIQQSGPPQTAAGAARGPVRVPTPARAPVRNPSPAAGGDGSITRPQQAILDAIAWMGSLGTHQVPREIVAFLAGASPNSSGFANNLGAMRTAGLIDYPSGGFVSLTADGASQAAPPDVAPTHADIMKKIADKLPRPQMAILYEAAKHYPEPIEREALATAVNASPSSSGYANNLGRLRTFGLITYPGGGQVRADDRLFP